MPYINCKSCNKRIYQSPYESKYFYSNFCNNCVMQQLEENVHCPNHETYIENCPTCKMYNDQKLKRTDREDDYLDSTRCEYTQTEYEEMVRRRTELKNKHQELKIKMAKLNEEIRELDIKIAVATQEQRIRKKIRRETRELIPSLKQVQENAEKIKKNILNELDNDNNDD